ncbi:MAG: hypothetical protein AAFX53_17980 [Bacteroidota bacterium]
MKKILSLFVLLLCAGIITAQNPFERFGYTPKIGTLSKGKYIEHFDTDSIVRIGSVLFNPFTKQITGFVKSEIRYSEATLQPEVVSRWLQPDPLAEEFYEWSPYNFVKNNPAKYIDPDGRAPVDVIISGNESQAAFNDLQASVQSELTLTMDTNGKVTYTQVGNGALSSDAQQLVSAIDDSSIVVNVVANDTDTTSSGNFFVGGAFMGNTVTQGQNGNANTVDAVQEINPDVLATYGNANSKPGAGTLHEVTEGYQGALVSQASGVSSPRAGQPGTVYSTAHANATPQPGNITVRYLGPDQNRGRGVVLGGYTLGNAPPAQTQRAEYISNGVVIQSYPK